ncbi:MAG: PASTA domain-containing protein [Spirochaetaceae bacterium]|jgi:beta-lactam-binding protein with PASTA domain|nr:PASTA domain-containing protein [Spirochaetaceae bacterium]
MEFDEGKEEKEEKTNEIEKTKETKEKNVARIVAKPRFFLWACVGLVFLVGIIAVTVFFVSVRGQEETMVPDVRLMHITEALLELQQRELYPRILLRHSKSADEKDTILEQDPRPGTIVKGGRRINLVVSQGVMVSAVDNYINRNIDEVMLDINALNANNPQPAITLKEPFLYQFSSKPMGTILEQKPPFGTGIFSTVALEFVISKGARKEFNQMPDIVGMKLEEAVALIDASGVRWTFKIAGNTDSKKDETIVDQEPAAGTSLPTDTAAVIYVAAPAELSENEVAGLFSYNMPENPYPLNTKLEVILPNGMHRTLTEMHHAGGEFSFPYKVPEGSVLVLSLLDREMNRFEIPVRKIDG